LCERLQNSPDEYLVANARAAVVSASEHLEARSITQSLLTEKEQVGWRGGQGKRGAHKSLPGGRCCVFRPTCCVVLCGVLNSCTVLDACCRYN
jgi:hypothetical protein